MITIFINHSFYMLFQRTVEEYNTVHVQKNMVLLWYFQISHNHTMVFHSITTVHVRKHGNTMIMNDHYINILWYFRGISRHWKEYHCKCTKTMKVSYTILNDCILILIWWYSHGVVKEYRDISACAKTFLEKATSFLWLAVKNALRLIFYCFHL